MDFLGCGSFFPPLRQNVAILSPRPMKSSPKVNDGQKSLSSSFDAHTYQRSSTVSSFTASQNSGVYFPARPFQDLKRTRSPELLSTEEDSVRSTRRSSARLVLLSYS